MNSDSSASNHVAVSTDFSHFKTERWSSWVQNGSKRWFQLYRKKFECICLSKIPWNIKYITKNTFLVGKMKSYIIQMVPQIPKHTSIFSFIQPYHKA